MSRLFSNELRKLFGRKTIFVVLLSLVLFNVFFLWYSNQSNDEKPPLNAYKKISNDLSVLPNEERPDFINRYYTDIKGIELVENVKMYESWQNEHGNTLANNIKSQNLDEYNHYLSLWESGEYLHYTKNIQQESALANEIYTEITQLSGYQDYLSEIEDRANILSGISIFSKETSDGFSSSNIQKTADDYSSMSHTEITYDVSYGVTSATSSLVTDCLVFIFLFIFAFLMIYDEKNKGLFSLVKSTPYGRLRLIACKMAVLDVSTAVIVFILYGCNIVFYGFTIGLGDLSRSIQSVGLFMGSTIKMSVGKFLISFMLLKWLACFLIGLIVMFASVFMRKSISAFISSGIILLVSFLQYVLIPANSQITILKHINLFGLFSAQDILGLYLNLNVFGKAISLFFASIVTISLLILIFASLNCIVFSKSRSEQPSRFNLRFSFCSRNKEKNVGKSVCSQELYKILWVNKTIIVLLGFAAVSIYSCLTSVTYLSPDELYYKSYMNQLEGEVTQEKIELLKTERARFEEVQLELDKLSMQTDSNDIQVQQKRESLERELYKQTVFERVWNQYEEIKNTDGWFVYETGYNELFDIHKIRNGKEMLIISLLLIICCYGIFTMEYTNGINQLIKTTPLGRGYTYKAKTTIAIVLMLLIVVIGMLPAIINISNVYGLSYLNAPICSLKDFSHMPSFISIGGFIGVLYLLKLIACTAVVMLIIFISLKTRHSIYTLLICTLIIAFPAILNVMGITWFSYLGFTPLFNAGALFSQGQNLLVAIYSLVAILVIAMVSVSRKHG